MSFFQENQFKASEVDTTDNFDPLPEGQYRVLVSSAEEKPTKAAGGLGLNVKYEVVDGKYKGRSVFHWINLRNKNKTAEEIGHKELARLCIATKVDVPRSPADFCGKLIQIVLKVEERDGEKRNAVKSIVLPSDSKVPETKSQDTVQPDGDAPPWGE